jgi:voltage-gated potassium channel
MAIEREWLGARASFLLTLAVGVLSVFTGVANIGVGTDAAEFVLFGALLPGYLRQVAAFTGTLTGFVLLLSAFGLRRGLKAAWYATLGLVPITAAQGLLQSPQRSLPLVGLSILTFLLVAINRRSFKREVELTTTQISAVAALVGAQAYGTVGAFALQEDFDGVSNLLDAFYFSLVTGSTVGYGDITPRTPQGELFALSVILVTVSSFAAVLGVVFTPLIEARFSKALGRMTEQQLDLLENHVLVLGYGDLTEPILEELAPRADVLIVTPDEERTRRLSDRGYTVLTADPSDEETQKRARVESARAVVAATNNDAEDALTILTARQLNPEVTIVAAATQRENVNKLKRAGADTVISPTTLGAHFLAESALGRAGVETLEQRLMGEDDGGAKTVEEAAERLGADGGDAGDDGAAEDDADGD